MAGQMDQLVRPGSGRGLLDVYGDRFLLKLLVRKEIKIRYRGSVLGLMWSYVKPLMQFLIYYIALGIFLNLEHGTPNYAIYLFAGIVLVNFFTESLSNSTRSIVWVSAAHFLPQLVVLIGACLLVGWAPSILQLGAVVLVFVMVSVLATGLGLMFGAVNVYFRDSENIVDMIVMVVTWASPVLYIWSMVERVMGPWYWLYQLNPMTTAVEIFHWAFWEPTLGRNQVVSGTLPPDLFTLWLPVSLLTTLAVLFLGQLTFRRLSVHFAQEL
jgi:ABC-2 type transport system permease protein